MNKSVVVPIALVALILTDCSANSAQPTVLETPAITWDLAAPSETDPYVLAALAGNLGWVLATNAADFTIEQYTSTSTAAKVQAEYEAFVTTYIDQHEPPRVYVGPQPFTLVDVIEGSDRSSAKVVFCYPSNDWYLSERHPNYRDNLDRPGTQYIYSIVTEDGDLKVADIDFDATVCDPAGAAVGVFDPLPAVRTSITEGDIRAPLTDGS